MTSSTLDQRDAITYKRILGIAFPIILSTLAQNVIAVADTVFLGNLGEVELGAAALAAGFYQVLVMVVFGFGVGAQIVIARRVGQGQYTEVGNIFQHTLWFCLFCSLLCWGAFQAWGEWLLPHLVKSPAILEALNDYMQIRVYGLPFAFGIVTFNALYVGIARTQTISIATIIMGTVNVALDYGLIFGKLGLPQMGMGGAALASVVAEAVGIICYFLLSAFSRYRQRYHTFKHFPFRLRIIGKLIGVSYPIMIQYFLSFSSYFLFFIFIESLGQRALAISNITRSMYMLFLLPIWGFCSSTATLTSYLCGQNRTSEIPIVVKKTCISTFVFVSLIVLLFIPFHKPILSIFTQDSLLAQESLMPCAVAIAATYIMIFAQIIFNTILGRGNTQAGFFIELINMITYFLYGWLVIYIGKCSVEVAFGAEITYTTGLLLLSLLYIFWQKKTGNLQVRQF